MRSRGYDSLKVSIVAYGRREMDLTTGSGSPDTRTSTIDIRLVLHGRCEYKLGYGFEFQQDIAGPKD